MKSPSFESNNSELEGVGAKVLDLISQLQTETQLLKIDNPKLIKLLHTAQDLRNNGKISALRSFNTQLKVILDVFKQEPEFLQRNPDGTIISLSEESNIKANFFSREASNDVDVKPKAAGYGHGYEVALKQSREQFLDKKLTILLAQNPDQKSLEEAA